MKKLKCYIIHYYGALVEVKFIRCEPVAFEGRREKACPAPPLSYYIHY